MWYLAGRVLYFFSSIIAIPKESTSANHDEAGGLNPLIPDHTD
jgi:hypothetical protein